MTTTVTFEQGTGFNPRIVRITTTSTLVQVTTAGWLNSATREGVTIQPSDKVLIYYGVGGTPGNAFFDVSIASGTKIITLSVAESNVILPVVAGDFANFSGTSGSIADLGYAPSNAAKTVVVMANASTVANHIMVSTDTTGTSGNRTGAAINDGNLQAGRSGLTGAVVSYPTTAASGQLIMQAANSSGDFFTSITNASMGQSTTVAIPDPGSANASFDLSKSAATALTNKIFVKTITATAAALATAGHVAVMTHPSATSQFKIMNIRVMYAASGLSGGGGDRLLTLTDGTIVFNQAGITAAVLGTPVYTLWGGTGNPIPGTVSTISTAGADIYLVYSGGAADYTTGQIVIEVELAQVTA